MTVFDTAWGVAKTRGFDIRDHNGEEDTPMPVEVPFKMRRREDNPCDHNMEITDESESDTGTLYRTYTCSKCGESSTSSPS